jgi:hypothetical protein
MLLRIILLSLSLAISTAAVAGDQLVEDILDKLVESYGGEQNLRKLERMSQEWTVVALMSKRHGTDLRSVRLPGKLRVVLSYPDRKETRLLDGEASYVAFGEDSLAIAQSFQRDAMRLQLMRLYSPLALRDRIDRLEILPNEENLILTLVENDLRADYMIDRDQWRIIKVLGTQVIGDREMRFLTEYSDFRFVEGVLVHHGENKFAGNVNTAVLELRRLELDVNFNSGYFLPPTPATQPGEQEDLTVSL